MTTLIVIILSLVLVAIGFYYGYDFSNYCHKTDTLDTLNAIKLKFTEARYEIYTNGKFHAKPINDNGLMFAEGLREAERIVNDKIAEVKGWKK